jgi:hypothetical protein
MLHHLCKKRLADVHAVPQVLQTCEHRIYSNRTSSRHTSGKLKSGNTLCFEKLLFTQIQIVDTSKSPQTRISIGFAGKPF